MGYAVYHVEKGKGRSGGIGKHIDRKESMGGWNTFEHRKHEETKNNRSFILNKHCEKSLPQAVRDRIKEGYKGEKAIRKDAVRFQTHILTGSHEQMKDIFADEKKKEQWIKANKEWMQERYGKENIVRFVLHVDERTPHIHAITVPLTKDGRLSAKEYTKGKKEMRDMQTDYANKMAGFGLKRGLERTGIKHETALEYYARQDAAEKLWKDRKIEIVEPKKPLGFTINTKEIIEQNKSLASLSIGLTKDIIQQEEQIKRKNIKLKEVGEANTNLRTKIKEIGVLINDPELLAKRYHQRIQEIEQLKQEQEEQLKQRRNPERDLDQEQRPRNKGMRM